MAKHADSKVPRVRFKGFSEKWREKPIGDVLWETKRSIVLMDDQRYELITIKRRNEGIVSRGRLRGKEILVKNYSQLKAGDFVISKRQVVHGATGIVPPELDQAIVSNEYLVAVGNDDSSTEFLAILSSLPDMRRKFLLSSYGVDIEKLFFDTADWKKRSVTIPTLGEQTRIAGYFRELDRLIGLHRQKHDKLMKLKKAMLQKMFPQPGATAPKVRFKGFSGEWTERKLRDLCGPLKYGLNAPAKNYDGRNKYIRITDIDDSSRDFRQTNLTTPDADLSGCTDYLLVEGDLLFARTGASVGKTYRYRQSDGRVFFAGFLIRARVIDPRCTDFIFCTTLTAQYEKFVEVNSQRSGQPGINACEYSEFSFHAPTPPEQQKIGTYFRTLDGLISQHALQLRKLQQLKSAYLEKMFV